MPWQPLLPLVALLLQPPTVSARQHYMFVGSQQGSAVIHSVVFDDATRFLWEDQTIAANTSHSWLAFNVGGAERGHA